MYRVNSGYGKVVLQTKLVEALQVDMKPNQLTRHLNVNVGRLLEEHWVMYRKTRTHNGRQIKIEAVQYQSDDP